MATRVPDRVPVSFVVVNWRRASETILTISHLIENSFENDLVVVVDNSPEPGFEARLKGVVHRRIVYAPMKVNVGFAGAANAGIRVIREEVSGGWIVILNSDVTFSIVFRRRLTNLGVGKGIGLVGPTTTYLTQPNVRVAGKSISLITGFAIEQDTRASGLVDVDCLDGRCLAINSAMIDALGGFDERYFSFWEDTEFCYRAHRFGYRVLADTESEVIDRRTPGIPGTISAYLMGRNRMLFLAENSPIYLFVVSTLFWFLVAIPGSFLKSMLHRDGAKWKRGRARLRGSIDGALMVMGISPRRRADEVGVKWV